MGLSFGFIVLQRKKVTTFKECYHKERGMEHFEEMLTKKKMGEIGD